ncbi:MAG: hypothetical protein JST04_15065 [Bdellovibrionales bacterium]|nr:hypothetical protein [Bdellovibrionales bacterium]
MELEREFTLSVEEMSRLRRAEAENFRLKQELELLEKRYEDTKSRLERVRSEASQAFRAAEQNRHAVSRTLQEARAHSLVAEAALKSKTEEIARLRALNQRLLGLVQPSQTIDDVEAADAARKYVELAASVRAEEALQKARAEWLRAQAPETGTDSGASDPEAGAVSGTSLGGSAGAETPVS